ncbi:GNAT family N-acetyltransferase [Paenibacillus sp. Y412MC10]|uniref:GNAT family N-acetyltransferase n=1 Tax=Geobacillus sp. (strain Y412MC10) TaxID=481743 RepID=UPI000178A814|nr:GNAT family N-acetyltransferase [Paenibacillus sp. Y412MC10]ACX65979.1 GCN5-related N-acetyltransferase [Paenibacillus sp. Y412MC10]
MLKRIEELTLNAWPALQTLTHHGWLLRFADGYTKRSNSINALYTDPTIDLDAQIHECERLYVKAGLDVVFKITPFNPQELDRMLDSRGYSILDPTSLRVLDQLDHLELPTYKEVKIEERLTDEWLSVLTEITGISEKYKAVKRKLFNYSVIQYGFFILYDHGEPVACGIGAIEQGVVGIFDLATAPACRNRGFGKQLLLHILHWAKKNGAASSYLQVVQNNVAANRLYDRLQYREIYSYWYRHKRIEG